MKLLNPPTIEGQAATVTLQDVHGESHLVEVKPTTFRNCRYVGETASSSFLRSGSFFMMVIVILVALVMMCGLFMATPALIGFGVPAWMPLTGIVIMFAGIICLAFGTMGIAG